MSEQAAPANDMQSVWFRLGQHEAAIEAHKMRSNQLEADMKEGFSVVHRRFDGVKTQLDRQDEKSAAATAEIMDAISTLRDGQATQKAQRGVLRWILARVEFIIGAGLGFAGAYFGGQR